MKTCIAVTSKVLLLFIGLSGARADCPSSLPQRPTPEMLRECITEISQLRETLHSEMAKNVSLNAVVSKLQGIGESFDEYILKVFLTEIVNDKGPRSEYAAAMSKLIGQGQIREAFKIFAGSIGQEIDMLNQVRIGYQRPTTVQVDFALFRTYPPELSAKPAIFRVVISRGQKLEVKATLLKYNRTRTGTSPDTPLDPDPGFPVVNLIIKCNTGCKDREIKIPSVQSASDFGTNGTKDLTDKIDWDTGDSSVTNLKFVELNVGPEPPPDKEYDFSAKFVVFVTNPIPQPKSSQ